MRGAGSAIVVALLLGGGTLTLAQEQEQAEVRATPIAISETRHADLAEHDQGFPALGLEVRLRLEGAAGEQATEWGNLRIDQAVDDRGTDLKPDERARFGRQEEFESFDRFAFMRSAGDRPPAARVIRIALKLPPREATTLAELRGQLQLRTGGEQKQVEITTLTQQLGKRIERPELEAAGIEVHILDPARERPAGVQIEGDTLPVRIVGDESPIRQMSIVGGDGQSVSHGRMSMGRDNQRTHHFELIRPLDDEMKFRIELLTGQQTITVPFELKDVALP